MESELPIPTACIKMLNHIIGKRLFVQENNLKAYRNRSFKKIMTDDIKKNAFAAISNPKIILDAKYFSLKYNIRKTDSISISKKIRPNAYKPSSPCPIPPCTLSFCG
jgi:hypothetical protein